MLERFELEPKGKIKKMSKGMKQKLGIVAAFMHDPDTLILDEPTSGLDPLMQKISSRFCFVVTVTRNPSRIPSKSIANASAVTSFSALITMYVSIIVSMYEPEMMKTLDSFAEAVPELQRCGRINSHHLALPYNADTVTGSFNFLKHMA